MKKKLSALFMVFAMVLSLFSGLGVNTVWADDNEGGGTDNVITGLAAKDWFDYDDEGQVTKPKDQAEWSKELWSAVDGLILLVQKLENGKKVLVSKPVTVNKNGNVSVKAEEGEYQLLNEKETKALQKEILKTVTPKTGNVSVDKGKKTTVKLSSKLDMDNVAKITYTSSDKSTVKVDKNGNIIAKKKGNVTVKVKVTLKDGTTKTVKVKVKVK